MVRTVVLEAGAEQRCVAAGAASLERHDVNRLLPMLYLYASRSYAIWRVDNDMFHTIQLRYHISNTVRAGADRSVGGVGF